MNNEIKDILISIIVPIYNVEKYVKKCIESIINQTYKNIEIILINDGSKDTSLSICKDYKNKDKRIKLINQENGGVSKARNKGLNIAKGEYIVFIDSDDYITKNYIEKLLNAAIETGADVVESNYIRIEDSGKIIEKSNIKNYYSKNNYEINKGFLENIFFKNMLWNKIFKKSVIKNLKFKDYKTSEDFEFLVNVYLNTNIKVNIEDYLYYYVNRNGSICNQTFSEKTLDVIYAREEVFKLYKNLNYTNLCEYISLKIINLIYFFYEDVKKIEKSKRKVIRDELKRKFRKYYKIAIKSNVRIGGLNLSKKHRILRYIQYTLFIFNPFLSCAIMRLYSKRRGKIDEIKK